MDDEEPEPSIDVSMYTTVRDAAKEFGVTENVIYQWIYREKIASVGVYPDRRKIFLHTDLAAAELKFRYHAKERRDPGIAYFQRLHSAKLREARCERRAARNVAA